MPTIPGSASRVGKTSAAQKHTHNVVILLVVVAIGAIAHRRSRLHHA
jgi:hypothetical protein